MGVYVKMKVTDEVSSELKKFGEKSPDMLSRALFSASMKAKAAVKASMRATLQSRAMYRDPKRAGKKHMVDEIMFTGVPKGKWPANKFKLHGPHLASIYEYNGADIRPKNGKVVKWRDQNGNWQSSDWVRIEPKPFFYKSVHDFVAGGEYDRALQAAIDRELEGIQL